MPRLISDDPEFIKDVVAACDLDRPAVSCVADVLTGRCRLSISFAADDDRIEKAAGLAERGQLPIPTNGARKRADRLVRDLIREAKRDAQPRDLEEAAVVAIRRERERNEAVAATPTAYTAMQRVFADASRREAQARADVLTANAKRWSWARTDGPPPPQPPPPADNGAAESEGE